jgi:hypothetical protein
MCIRMAKACAQRRTLWKSFTVCDNMMYEWQITFEYMGKRMLSWPCIQRLRACCFKLLSIHSACLSSTKALIFSHVQLLYNNSGTERCDAELRQAILYYGRRNMRHPSKGSDHEGIAHNLTSCVLLEGINRNRA